MLLLLRVQQQKESFGSLFRLPFTHNNEKSSNIFDSAELIVSDTYSWNVECRLTSGMGMRRIFLWERVGMETNSAGTGGNEN